MYEFTKNMIKKAVMLLLTLIGLLSLCIFVSYASTETKPAVIGTQPPEHIFTETAVLSQAVITNDRTKINIKGTVSGERSTEDTRLFLFELKPYENNIGNRNDYIKAIDNSKDINITLDLLEGSADTRLYSKFVLAVLHDGMYREISNYQYITNPEAVAKSTLPYKAPLSKKGLLIELGMIGDAFELGVKHVIVNINFSQFIGSGIDYNYEGKVYHFNSAVVAEYDKTISTMSGKSMLVTAVVLNGWNPATPELIYPGVQKNKNAIYYGFNTSTKEGYETTRALASFLAQRYSGENTSYGRVSNWIIGNEINNNQIWNYMGNIGLEEYIREYERSFRVFYTAMKSQSANARLFYSLDYDWNYKDESNMKYSGKKVFDSFANNINSHGNIDWNIAYHPYPIPLTEPEFWDDEKTGLIKQDESSSVINFANLHVLTDYMEAASLRDTKGKVRHVILSEQGFTSKSPTRGSVPDLQAAAFAYAYYIADSNPYIDAFILSRQVDSVIETRQSLAFGLWTVDESSETVVKAQQRKKLWSVFKNIDNKKETLSQTEFAKDIIGIKKWSDVISNFRYKALEK